MTLIMREPPFRKIAQEMHTNPLVDSVRFSTIGGYELVMTDGTTRQLSKHIYNLIVEIDMDFVSETS